MDESPHPYITKRYLVQAFYALNKRLARFYQDFIVHTRNSSSRIEALETRIRILEERGKCQDSQSGAAQ